MQVQMHENHKLKNPSSETCKKICALSKIQTRDGSDTTPRLFPLGHWACGYWPCRAGFIVNVHSFAGWRAPSRLPTRSPGHDCATHPGVRIGQTINTVSILMPVVRNNVYWCL